MSLIDIQAEAEADALLAERNARIREQWKSDPEFRQRVRSRHKAILAQRRSDEENEEYGQWLTLWRKMNGTKTSERRAKEGCRKLWEELEEEKNYVSSVTADPDDAPKKEPKDLVEDEDKPAESFGAADEF